MTEKKQWPDTPDDMLQLRREIADSLMFDSKAFTELYTTKPRESSTTYDDLQRLVNQMKAETPSINPGPKIAWTSTPRRDDSLLDTLGLIRGASISPEMWIDDDRVDAVSEQDEVEEPTYEGFGRFS